MWMQVWSNWKKQDGLMSWCYSISHLYGSLRAINVGSVPSCGLKSTQFLVNSHIKNQLGIIQGDTQDDTHNLGYVTTYTVHKKIHFHFKFKFWYPCRLYKQPLGPIHRSLGVGSLGLVNVLGLGWRWGLGLGQRLCLGLGCKLEVSLFPCGK
jgi:hypothetical protein